MGVDLTLYFESTDDGTGDNPRTVDGPLLADLTSEGSVADAMQPTLMEILQSESLSPTPSEYGGPVATGTTYEIRDAEGRTVRVGTILNGDFTIYRNFMVSGERAADEMLPPLWLSALDHPLYTIGFSCVLWRGGSGDGRGGNARDRRKARRAGRLWRSLGEVVRDTEDAPDASEHAASLQAKWGPR